MKRIKAYEAVNENPRVFVAFGDSPSATLKNMAKILKENGIHHWSASHVDELEDDGKFYINIYI